MKILYGVVGEGMGHATRSAWFSASLNDSPRSRMRRRSRRVRLSGSISSPSAFWASVAPSVSSRSKRRPAGWGLSNSLA